MTFETAKAILLSDPRFFGAMLVRQGRVDGMVAGSNSPTAHVLRAAILVIGPKPGLKTVSSSFIMITNATEFGDNGVFVYSDAELFLILQRYNWQILQCRQQKKQDLQRELKSQKLRSCRTRQWEVLMESQLQKLEKQWKS